MSDRVPPAAGAAADPAAAAGDLALGAARFWDGRVASPDAQSRHWLESPQAARLVNRRVTGREGVYPLVALAEQLRGHLPIRHALSVGCGTGSLEREAVLAGMVERIDGIDVSAAALDCARDAARADAGLARRIAYTQVDAATWLAATEPGRYQLIVFHGSLHHIAELEVVLAHCATVLRGAAEGLGWLYLDEYVGPSRDQWCDADLAPARQLFAQVPAELRRTPRLDQPMDQDDPSEMVRSADIEPVLRSWFEVESYRPYHGNLLYPLLSAVRADAYAHPAVERLVAAAAAREDALAAGGSLRPLFACYLARPRPAAEAAERAAVWFARQGAALEAAGADQAWLDGGPLPSYETELGLRRLLAQRTAEQRDLYREIGRLGQLIKSMESARAWRLHAWLERHVRVPLRRLGRRG
jgi:SAM-dependent methyltransferase